MRIVAMYFGDMRVSNYYEGQILEGLDPMGQSSWENRECEVGRVEELVRGERRASMSELQLSAITQIQLNDEKNVLC